jgi:hypothetical protein
MYKIAISGFANTGKNTLGKMIVKQLRDQTGQPLSVSYLALANPIKQMTLDMFPDLPRKYLYGPSKFRSEIIPGAFKDGKPLTVRQVLFDIGTAVGRGYKDDIWLDNFDAHVRKNAKKDIIVVPDERFPNEFKHLKAKGFFQIRLYRPNSGPAINHISETGQTEISDDEFDVVIHNDKKLSHLKEKITSDIIPLLVNS